MRWTKPTAFFVTFFIGWLILISALWQKPLILTIILLIISCLYFLFFKEKNWLYYFWRRQFLGQSAKRLFPRADFGLITDKLFLEFLLATTGLGITAVALHKYLVNISEKN